MSRIKFLSLDKIMKKLRPWQVVEIIGARISGKSAYKIGKKYGVSARWVRHLASSFIETGDVPKIKAPGRAPKPITNPEMKLVAGAYDKFHLGAVRLEKLINMDMDVKMSHNRIHDILLKLKAAKKHRAKSERRKWVRFERYKSNSLWHTDWTKIGDKWLIAFIDDASRFVTGWGVFSNANTENSVLVLERAIASYGTPLAILTGHDVQFTSVQMKTAKKSEPNRFQKFLAERKIKHILGRVNHPQTNGKIERLFGTVKQKRKEFPTLEALFHWYNNVRPHMSLKDGLETPAEAFVRKMRTKKKIAVEMVVR